MGIIVLYALFCCAAIVGVVAAIVAGVPVNVAGAVGVWAVAGGAIAAVLLRFRPRRR